MYNKENLTLAEEHFDNAYKFHTEGKIEEAIEAYKISIEHCPSARAHTCLAWAYSVKEKYYEAIQERLIALDLDPLFGNPYNDIGSYLMNLKKYSEAIVWLERAIKKESYEQCHYPYYNLGLIYEKKGDWLKAMQCYNNALKINSDYEAAQIAILRISTLLN